METPLLRTKLYIPPARPEWMTRPRLIDHLDAGLASRRRLTLIVAPAGFGKTSLVSEWLRQTSVPSAWLSLDEADNDLVRFLTYLVVAVRDALAETPAGLEHGPGQQALAMLRAAQPQAPSAEAVLTALINDLVTAAPGFLLILDDYHRIETRSIHEALTFLLDHAPPSLHLVLITRADPPLPIARLRARGQLSEVRQHDLRFTPDEATTFLNQVMGLDLVAEDIAALEARTEGWIVGLQLAAISLQGRADAHDFIAAFSGGHTYVLEYLTDEVIRRQPERVQRFLVTTSILERLCGPLCDAVTGQHDSEAVLKDLQRRNLFIVPLDVERHWYRYHHLFADLLGGLLRRERSSEQICLLRVRASEWYERNGLIAEAVDYALAAPDFERAAGLIERHSLATVMRGELATLLRWIAALPDEIARSRPWLCLHQAWPLALAGRAADAESLLHEIERHVAPESSSPEQREILGNAAAMRALLAVMGGDMARAVKLAHRADALLPPEPRIPRNIIPFALASAYAAEGALDKATEALEEELRIGQAAAILWTVVRALCDLADLQIVQGQLRRAEHLCQEALAHAEARGARQFGMVGYVLVKLGNLLYERNDLVAAKEHVSEGVALMQGWQQPYEMIVGYTSLAAVLGTLHDTEGASKALHQAEQIQKRHHNYPKLGHLVRVGQVELALARGDAQEAARQVTQTGLGQARTLIDYERERIALARVFVAQTRWDGAAQVLDSLTEDAQAGGRYGHLIKLSVLRAIVWLHQGDTVQALNMLKKALELGGPEGYVRTFVDQGAAVAAMLGEASQRGMVPDYTTRLLAAFPQDDVAVVPQVLQPGASALIEALTDRELEVLGLIGEGYSNQDIVDALVISLNTVKKHASNIYGKLGVRSRTQAVARAQELGLL